MKNIGNGKKVSRQDVYDALWFDRHKVVYIDIETSDGKDKGSLDPWMRGSVIALVQTCINKEVKLSRWNDKTRDWLRSLHDEGYTFVGHNFAFDMAFFRVNGLNITRVIDTLILSQVLNAGITKPDEASFYAVKEAASSQIEMGLFEALFEEDVVDDEEESDDDEVVVGTAPNKKKASRFLHNLAATAYRYADVRMKKTSATSNWLQDPLTPEQIKYAEEDVIYLERILMNLCYFGTLYGMMNIFQLESEARPAFVAMRVNGLLLDREAWEDAANENLKISSELKVELDDEYGMLIGEQEDGGDGDMDSLFGVVKRSFNVGSDTKLKKFYAVEKADVATLSKVDHPLIPRTLLFKEHKKLASTYGEGFLKYLKYDGRMHSEISQAAAATGRTTSQKPNLQNCASKDTEILTINGWVRFDELDEGVPVAQFDKDTDEITFVEPLSYIKHWYEGDMLHMKSDQFDLLFTPDHRFLMYNRKSWNSKDVLGKDWMQDKAIKMSGFYTQGDLNFDSNAIRLMVALQADGHIRKDRDSVDWGFSKRRKFDRLRQILDAMNVPYLFSTEGRRLRIYVDKADCNLFMFSDITDKTIGNWVLNLKPELIDVLLEEVFYWDGLSTRKSNYSSNNVTNVDTFQALFILRGRRARRRLYKESNWQLDIPVVNTRYAMTTNVYPEPVPYDDYVYCVEVPTSYIITRRNGKAAVVGNCPPDMIKGFTRVDEGYIQLTVDYSSVESRILAYAANDQAFIDSVNSSDVHTANARKIFKIPDDIPVDKEIRRKAKGVSFGLSYGISAMGLVTRGFAKDKEEGQRLIDSFFGAFKDVSRFLKQYSQDAVIKGYTQDPFGRIRWYDIPSIVSVDEDTYRMKIGSAQRQGQNMPIQSMSANITKKALALCNEYLERTGFGHMTLTIHDSIFFALKKEHVVEAGLACMRLMEEAGVFILPGARIPVDGDWGYYIKRKCKVTNAVFKVYEYVLEGDKLIENPQWLSDDTVAALMDLKVLISTDYTGMFAAALDAMQYRDDEWRGKHSKFVKSMTKLAELHAA